MTKNSSTQQRKEKTIRTDEIQTTKAKNETILLHNNDQLDEKGKNKDRLSDYHGEITKTEKQQKTTNLENQKTKQLFMLYVIC